MALKRKWMAAGALGVLLFISSAFASNETSGKKPSAFLPERIFKFEYAVDGDEITHDFILQNKGDETLFIEKLKSG